jgi:CheY-like chemotaxis protein
VLGIVGYLIECAEQAVVRLTTTVEDTAVHLSIRVEPPTAVQPTPKDEVQERLVAFDEMAQSSNVNILTLHAGQAVVGFDVQLPTVERIVLVVDDNEDVLKLIQRFLMPHHYRVITAQTAQEALELSRETRPHVITLDLMMPDQDGWDLLQALLNQPETQKTPIVVCSVLKQQKDLALSLGATAFLKKPITEEGLLTIIESLEVMGR